VAESPRLGSSASGPRCGWWRCRAWPAYSSPGCSPAGPSCRYHLS